MKKYKFKPTDEVIEFETSESRCISGRNKEGTLIVLPVEMIEKSEDWVGVKDVLFTTIDGVDIHDGEAYCLVRTGNGRMTMFTYTASKETKALWQKEDHKLFSTRDKAAEYVFFHTPCISLADLFPNGPEKTNYYWKTLEMAKNKCNG